MTATNQLVSNNDTIVGSFNKPVESNTYTRLRLRINQQVGNISHTIGTANGVALNFITTNDQGNEINSDFLRVVPDGFLYNSPSYMIILETARAVSGDFFSQMIMRRDNFILVRRRHEPAVDEIVFDLNTTNKVLTMWGNIICNGSLFMRGNTWHYGAGRMVFYFESSGRNYYTGGSSSDSSINPHIWRNRDNTDIVSITHGGKVNANDGFANVSDIRIKKEIVDADEKEGLEKILLIEVEKYKYIDEETKGTHEVMGFIAQQVKTVISYAINLGEGTLPLSNEKIEDFHYLDKMMIYTHNVSATQELHRIIMRQQEVINDLISRIEVLES